MKQKDFDRLVESIKQAGAIRRGRLKPSRVTEFRPDDIRAIRVKLAKSKAEFALMIGVSVATLQSWEQGRRQGDRRARFCALPRGAQRPSWKHWRRRTRRTSASSRAA